MRRRALFGGCGGLGRDLGEVWSIAEMKGMRFLRGGSCQADFDVYRNNERVHMHVFVYECLYSLYGWK